MSITLFQLSIALISINGVHKQQQQTELFTITSAEIPWTDKAGSGDNVVLLYNHFNRKIHTLATTR